MLDKGILTDSLIIGVLIPVSVFIVGLVIICLNFAVIAVLLTSVSTVDTVDFVVVDVVWGVSVVAYVVVFGNVAVVDVVVGVLVVIIALDSS